MTAARWEICRSDAGWWARFRAANNRVVMSTETYTRKRGAENAIESVTGSFITGRGFVSNSGGRYLPVIYLDFRAEAL